MRPDEVMMAVGLIVRDIGRQNITNRAVTAEALSGRLDASACWQPVAVAASMSGSAAIGTPLPRWKHPGAFSTEEASAVTAGLDQSVRPGAQFLRLQVDTTVDAAVLRRIDTFGDSVVVPSFRSRGSLSTELSWRWPLRVGIVDGDRSDGWLTDVQDSGHHGVVYDAEALVPEQQYEIAIVHRDDLDGATSELVEQLRRASCVIAVGQDAAIELLHGVEDRVGPVIAIGVASPPGAWWNDFVDAMTHDLPIDVAVAKIRRTLSIDAEIAGPRRGMDVTAAACWLTVVAHDDPVVEHAIDHAPGWDWTSEGDNSWRIRDVVDEARSHGVDPRAIVPLSASRPLGSSPPMAAPAAQGPPPPPAVPLPTTTGRPRTSAAPMPTPEPNDVSPPTPADDNAQTATDSAQRTGRFVYAVVATDDGDRTSLVAGQINRLRCWIGPDRGEFGSRSTESAPEVGRDVTLHVDLLVGRAVVASDSIFLPGNPAARSSECELAVPPLPIGFFSGELAFTLDGRMYELVSVTGAVLAPGSADGTMPGMQLESLVDKRELIALDERSPSAGVLDVALDGGNVMVRTFGHRSHGVFDLTNSMPLVRRLTSELYATEVSLVRKQQQEGTAASLASVQDDLDPDWSNVLRSMAKHGWLLHERLREQGFSAPGARFEVVNRLPDGYVPIEFVYDRGNPAADATIDPACLDDLRSGELSCCRCTSSAELSDRERDANPRICPFGFWSLSKIIERHDGDESGRIVRSATSTNAVNRLHRIDSVLAGWSARLRPEDATALPEQLRRRGHRVSTVDSWERWKAELANEPSILLALPHHEEVGGISTLEIGNYKLELGQALDLYVRTPAGEPGPILILLGCQTNDDGALGHPSFARRFSPHASVVIGTLSKVLGRHAAPFAHALVDALVDAQDGGGDVGAVVRDVRRRMFADGYLMALGVIALGDADWRLAGTVSA